MQIIFKAAAIFMFSAAVASADDCVSYYTLAGRTMEARQADVPADVLYDTIKEAKGGDSRKKDAIKIIDAAYEYPILFRHAHKDELIALFAELAYRECKGGEND